MLRLLVPAMALLATPALAAVEVATTLDLGGSAQIQHISYGCGGDAPLTVTYINAEPNFLAIVPVDGEKRVFVNVLSASGAKYVSGEYEWWSKGTDATLHNVMEGLDAAPVLTCAENIETP